MRFYSFSYLTLNNYNSDSNPNNMKNLRHELITISKNIKNTEIV